MVMEDYGGHIKRVCLPPELCLAVASMEVKHGISEKRAILRLMTRGAAAEGVITKPQNEELMMRYSRKLIPQPQQEKLTREQVQEKQKLEEKARLFRGVISDWKYDHKLGWKDSWKKSAAEWADRIPEAKKILEME